MSVLNLELLRVFGESRLKTALVQSVTTGIIEIAGFGFSFTFVSCGTSVGEYFDGKAKLVAISIIGTGAGCGGMVIPFLLDYLIEMYGLRGCVLIVGGLVGNMICFFAVCKPKSVGLHKTKLDCSGNADRKQSAIHQPLDEDRVTIDNAILNNKNIPGKQNTCTEKLNSLRKNYIFIIFIFGISLTFSAFGAALIYMLEFFKKKGFAEDKAMLFYFYMNISATLGRLIPGLCILLPHIDGLVISAICTIVSCLSSLGLLGATTYYQHVILMCVFGMTLGCANTVLSMTTMELVGLDNYAIGMGILLLVIGPSSICAGAVSGWLVDLTGSYHASYYSVAVAHGVACCLFVLAATLQKFNRSQAYCKCINN
ncbi:Monocarboxylate transporter 12 [Mizuhopecten yessoensis]|uniref:Monocarboxylate transporter 12 n=1 Tax=Mizuhopecten yessoensis TaxID=6573 RepID=A0A210Q5B3_MIZYE|nr:Monocarboxylate transporter 12 [Mizuhopecten yessoensis]